MATYTIRGTSHNVVYTYKAADGKRKQQWESYSSELEAIQRKAYIDYLQAQNRTSDITHEASEYRSRFKICFIFFLDNENHFFESGSYCIMN